MAMHVLGVLLMCSVAWWSCSHGYYHHRYWPRNTIETWKTEPSCKRPMYNKIIDCNWCDDHHEPNCTEVNGRQVMFCEHGTFLNDMCANTPEKKKVEDCCKNINEACYHDEQCLYDSRCSGQKCEHGGYSEIFRPMAPPSLEVMKGRGLEDNLYDEYSLDESPNIIDSFMARRMIENYYEYPKFLHGTADH